MSHYDSKRAEFDLTDNELDETRDHFETLFPTPEGSVSELHGVYFVFYAGTYREAKSINGNTASIEVEGREIPIKLQLDPEKNKFVKAEIAEV